MFQLLFGYPFSAYSQGKLSLLSGWPRPLLILALLGGAALLGWRFFRRGMLDGGLPRRRSSAMLMLQTSMWLILLLMLWRPALVVTTAAPRQNIAAVLLDDSASMTLETPSRLERAKQTFGAQSALMKRLGEKFQVRTYRFSDVATRVQDAQAAGALTGDGKATRLDDAINGVLTDLEGFPLGAVVLVTDGADNSPFTEHEQSGLSRLKAAHVPLHTVGVGKPAFDRDLQVNDVSVAPTALAGGVISAAVSVHQEGYAGKTVNLEVRDGGTLLQKIPVTFERPSQTMTVRVNFTPRSKGLREYTFALPEEGDEIRQNNAQSRVIQVEDRKSKILWVEGEPRWDYKFVRRAVFDDPAIELHGLLRTSANKFYRQGMESEKVLETGFPKAEELFGYSAVVVGSVEAGFFSAEDAQNLYDFVSRRGGGLLMFGARSSMSEGGWQNTILSDLVPLSLNAKQPTFFRAEGRAALTPYGLDHPMLQLGADAAKTAARWKLLPLLGDYTRLGEPKPGAVVLATVTPEGERNPLPLMVTQRFGRGHTMLFASGSSWRWKMEMDHADDSHVRLWRQIARWLIEETPARVQVSSDRPLYRDDRSVALRVEVRDKTYRPVDDAGVTATVTAPDGTRTDVRLDWSPRDAGAYTGTYQASGTGVFTVEAAAKSSKGEDLGKSASFFERTAGTLEYFDAQQNRALLARLATETGGRYYTLDDAKSLPDDIVYTQGGITERDVHELWSLPVFFLLLLVLKGAEWCLRKWWGTV
jgi:uncharacterized membrane protein/nitrogen fixation protein FixH